jgi:hypothetical protein
VNEYEGYGKKGKRSQHFHRRNEEENANLNLDSRSLIVSPESNPVPPEYEAGVLTI